MTSTQRLHGKVAVVTGGGSGFGAAICHLFAAEGCTVLVVDINDENGRRTAASNSTHMTYQHADVAEQSGWRTIVETVKDKWNRLDILVNNAGTTHDNKPTLNISEDDFDLVMNVNVKSIFWSVKECIPLMLGTGEGGSVINISSIAAERPRGGLVWYAASKGAVLTATKGLAAEYAPRQIRFNAILPLLSATGLFEKFTGVQDTPENQKKFLFNVPMGRLTQPSDVAKAALYFASDDSSFITGTSLQVDGGRAI